MWSFELVAGVAEGADRDLPLGIFLSEFAAIMCVLIEQVENGAVRTGQHMCASNFDQLSSFRKANDVRALRKGSGHTGM